VSARAGTRSSWAQPGRTWPRLVSLTGARAATGIALAAGQVSRAQAEVIVAAVDRLPGSPALRAAAEAVLLDQAAHADATELGVIGARILAQLDPDGTDRRDQAALAREDRAAHASRFLSITEDGIGGVRVKDRGTLEDAAHLKAMLLPLAAPTPTGEPGACGATPRTPGGPGTSAGAGSPLGACGVTDCAHQGKDPREHGTRMWDALIGASRLLSGTTPVRLDPADRRPEFIPPPRLDPTGTPRRRQPLRT